MSRKAYNPAACPYICLPLVSNYSETVYPCSISPIFTMLGLTGKEADRDHRFKETLPLDPEKANDAARHTLAHRRTLPSALLQKYRNLPLISKIVSLLAALWIAFTGMRFLHWVIAGDKGRWGHRHGWKGMGYTYEEVCLALYNSKRSLIRTQFQPAAVDVVFNPVGGGSQAEFDSQTSSPIYLRSLQALEIFWDDGVKGSLSIQEANDIAEDQPYVFFQTTDKTKASTSIEASATSERLRVLIKSLDKAPSSEKIYDAILRLPIKAPAVPPIRMQGAEATLELTQAVQQMKFSRLQVDSLINGFDFDNLQVDSLRVSSGTGDISGSFNVSRELDLRTST